MNTILAFAWWYTENPIPYQKFDLRETKLLRGGQPTVDFDAADKSGLYVTTMKTMNFQDDIPSIPIDIFKDHYVLVFELNSIKDATEKSSLPWTSWRTTEDRS